MKKILSLILCLISLAVSAQQTRPTTPVQKAQNSAYLDTSTGIRWYFDGVNWFAIPPYSPPNTLLTGLSMTVVSSTLTVHTGTWRIGNVVYTLGSNANFTLKPRDTITHYYRYEAVYAIKANNGIGLKVDSLTPSPIQHQFGTDTLTVGYVLVTPTGYQVVPPIPTNQFVFSNIGVSSPAQQVGSYPSVTTMKADTFKVGGHYILPPIDGTSGQVIQTDGAGNLFWSNQAIYLPLYPITISANNIGADTTGSTRGLVTHNALLDTLRKNAAHFNPTQFIIGNDTINLNPRDTTTVDSVLGMKNGRLYKGKGGSGGTYTGSHGVGLVGSDFRLVSGTLAANVSLDAEDTHNLGMQSNDGGLTTSSWLLTNGVFNGGVNQSGTDLAGFSSNASSGNSFFQIYYNVGVLSKSITMSNGLSVAGIGVKDNVENVGLNGDRVFPLTLGTQYAQYHKVDSIAKAKADSVKGTITGGVTSITPGVGFLSHTPITTSGTMNIDTASTIVTKTFAGRYVTNSSTTAFTNKTGNISQWTNDSGYALLASPTFTGTPLAPTATGGTNTTQIATTAFVQSAVSGVTVPTGANPTATAGSSAVNGSAATFMRSDAAPKVDSAVFQTILNYFPKGDTRYLQKAATTLPSSFVNSSLTSVGTLGALTVTAAPTFSAMTSGSVLFAGTSGLLSQNNANLFWDNTNKFLGVGTNAPADFLHILAGTTSGGLTVEETNSGTHSPWVSVKKGTNQVFWSLAGATDSFFLGTAAGDMIFRATTGKNIWLGASDGSTAASLEIVSGGEIKAVAGDVNIATAGKRLKVAEGTNGFAGQTTLVSGTKAITITGVTTSSRAFCQLVTQGGTVTTTQVYGAVCTANTLTITALTTAGATDTTDTSILNYFIIN